LGLAVVVFTSVVVGACEQAPGNETNGSGDEQVAEAESEETESDSSTSYSPFGVSIENSEDYELISFKDVGLESPGKMEDTILYEAIAQSLAYQLRIDSDLELEPRVVHKPALADPDNHTYCEKDRVYVDLWQSESPRKWGYSLWSGCSKAQRFAWEEVPASKVDPDALAEGVKPLTSNIVESLQKADETDCYQRTC
jgi:hypothetical protein